MNEEKETLVPILEIDGWILRTDKYGFVIVNPKDERLYPTSLKSAMNTLYENLVQEKVIEKTNNGDYKPDFQAFFSVLDEVNEAFKDVLEPEYYKHIKETIGDRIDLE